MAMARSFFSPKAFWQQTGIAAIRMITGGFLIYHGWEIFDRHTMKGYEDWEIFRSSFGSFMIYLGKGAELVSGLLLALGWFTRIACIIIAGTMLYISFFIGEGRVWYQDQHPFLFALIALLFFFTGPGRWSLDALFFSKSNEIQV